MSAAPKALLPVVANERFSRQILSFNAGGPGISVAGGTSVSVPWPATAGAVSANVRTFLAVALKPGTANLGDVDTPSGWTLAASFLGGGYGSTPGGNSRVFLFYKDNDNTTAGSLPVSLTPDGANGVASGSMSRFEKQSGSWASMATATAEATVDGLVGVYTPAALTVSRGDVFVYACAFHQETLTGIGLDPVGVDMVNMSPVGALSWGATAGFRVGHLIFPKRARAGGALGNQIVTLGNGDCRGPMVIARMRVR